MKPNEMVISASYPPIRSWTARDRHVSIHARKQLRGKKNLGNRRRGLHKIKKPPGRQAADGEKPEGQGAHGRRATEGME
jgi:hypothetical protein